MYETTESTHFSQRINRMAQTYKLKGHDVRISNKSS